MTKPLSPERFAVLVERAGLTLTPERFEDLREGTRFVERMKESVRRTGPREVGLRGVPRPREKSAEPAHIFIAGKD
jgi:hypothetical protein